MLEPLFTPTMSSPRPVPSGVSPAYVQSQVAAPGVQAGAVPHDCCVPPVKPALASSWPRGSATAPQRSEARAGRNSSTSTSGAALAAGKPERTSYCQATVLAAQDGLIGAQTGASARA